MLGAPGPPRADNDSDVKKQIQLEDVLVKLKPQPSREINHSLAGPGLQVLVGPGPV